MNLRGLSLQRGSFLSIAALCTIGIGPTTIRGQSLPGRPDLSGTVCQANDTPVPGATAYIYTAAPRRGTSPY